MTNEEEYEKKYMNLISDNPELALDIHMETREERDKARKDARTEKIVNALTNVNVRCALEAGRRLENLEAMYTAYTHIMRDLEKNNPELYARYSKLREELDNAYYPHYHHRGPRPIRPGHVEAEE